MILRRGLLYNAGPFLGEHEFELPEGVTAVLGEYLGRDAASNRAGKSWLAVDSVLYALHGWFRGRPDDFAHRAVAGSDEAFVEWEVESSEGTVYVIRRGRTAGGSALRTLDGAEIKDADLEVAVRADVLGLSRDEHLLTTAFVQGQMHGFMAMTPERKRQTVSPWFRTDRWATGSWTGYSRARRGSPATCGIGATASTCWSTR